MMLEKEARICMRPRCPGYCSVIKQRLIVILACDNPEPTSDTRAVTAHLDT